MIFTWSFGLEVFGCPSPSLLLYNCCFSILVLQMNQLGSCFFFFLFTNADVLASCQTHWMKISVFFFKASNMILRQAQRGDFFFCLFCLFKQAGPSEFFKLYRTLSWLWTLSFSNSIITNIISGATQQQQQMKLKDDFCWAKCPCALARAYYWLETPKICARLWSH